MWIFQIPDCMIKLCVHSLAEVAQTCETDVKIDSWDLEYNVCLWRGWGVFFLSKLPCVCVCSPLTHL